MAHVVVSDIVKRYGEVGALNGVSLTIASGQVVALLGPSGCGKTTLLRCLAGLEVPTSGSIAIDDDTVCSADRVVPPERRDIGLVFQSYALWPNMTVYQNVCYPLKRRHLPPAERRRRVMDSLEMLGLSGYETRYPGYLSGGQQQRVAVARAIVARPRLLLFDEPLSNLDAKLREHIRVELSDLLTEMRITSVYVTHDQHEAMAIGHRVVLMREGRILHDGPAEDLYHHPVNRFAADFVGTASFVSTVATGPGQVPSTIRTVTSSGFEICARTTHPVRTGDKVLLVIRPEDVSLTPAREGGPTWAEDGIEAGYNRWTARILRRVYLGSRADYWVQVGDVTIRAEMVGETMRLDPGQHVRVSINPDRIVCLPEDSDEADGALTSADDPADMSAPIGNRVDPLASVITDLPEAT